MNWRRVLVAVALLAFAVGVGSIVAPGTFGLGIDRYAVIVLGLLALGQTVRLVQARRRGRRERAETATPELPPSIESPGEDLDAVLSAFGRSGVRAASHRREQLRGVAREVLARYGDDREATPDERIDRGTWTDDPVAAAFLAEDAEPVSLRRRLRARVAGESSYWQGIDHTVAAIADVAGVATDGREGRSRAVLGRLRGSLGGPAAGVERDSAIDDPDPVERATGHWRGIGAAALAAIAAGVLAERPGVLLVGVVAIGYAAYARSARVPEATVSVDRTVEPTDPDPGESVTVSVTVTNDGDRLLPDVRVVDGVPPALSVVDGSARLGTALRSGSSATLTYTVEARRGRHDFDPAQVLVRNLAGTAEREQGITAIDATPITCLPTLEPVGEPLALRQQPTQFTGRVDTATGGAGVEFFATREYRSGDPMSRIDWNRHARTGDLATLEFREERAATVVLVIDRDGTADAGPEPRGETAIQRSVDAASRVFTTLLGDGNRVGIAALGDTDCWLPPGAGEVHRAKARELLATHPALTPGERPDTVLPFGWLAQLRGQLPGDAQIVLFSPLCSAAISDVARQLDAYGHLVTVVSPDPTTTDSPASQLATVARRFRIADLQSAGIPVVDWSWDDSLSVALARSTRRWSR